MLQSIEGEEASGKTTLAYTAPCPIVGFQFDLGSDRALFGAKYEELFADKKIQTIEYRPDNKPCWAGYDITIYELPSPIQLTGIRLQGFIERWECFIGLIAKAMIDPYVSSLVVDTMTIARRIKADAWLEHLQQKAFDRQGNRIKSVELREQLIQIEWGKPNDGIRDLYTASGGSRKNLAAVHHLTDERKDLPVGPKSEVQNVTTGRRILEGLAQTHRFVDVALRTDKDSKTKAISCTILKCGYDLKLEGTVIPSPTWGKVTDLIRMSSGGRIRL